MFSPAPNASEVRPGDADPAYRWLGTFRLAVFQTLLLLHPSFTVFFSIRRQFLWLLKKPTLLPDDVYLARYCNLFVSRESPNFRACSRMTSSPTSAQTSTSFFKDEFERALSEQSFGISSYELSSSTSLDANATIELLEKTKVVINLSIRGYKVIFQAALYQSSMLDLM